MGYYRVGVANPLLPPPSPLQDKYSMFPKPLKGKNKKNIDSSLITIILVLPASGKSPNISENCWGLLFTCDYNQFVTQYP